MTFKLSLIASLLLSGSALAQNILIDGDFEQQNSPLTQFTHDSSPWQLVDYLDKYSAIAGQYQPDPANIALSGHSVMFVKNGAVRQLLSEGLIVDESYVLSLDLGRATQGGFPEYRIGLQAGDQFVELASSATHGVPKKGQFRTLEVEYHLGEKHHDFISGTEPVYLLIEALAEAGSNQLLVDNVSLTQGELALNSRVLDSDQDGMPDQWETRMGLDLLDDQDAELDTDGDGVSNLEEYQAQSDPRNPTDQLKPLQGLRLKQQKLAQAPSVNSLARLPIEISGIRFIPQSADPLTCDAGSEGGTYYNSSTKLTMVCNGTSWIAVQGQDLVDDADADVTNEIQILSRTGTTISLSRSGGSVEDKVDDADADVTNEIQTLTRSGSTISLSKSGGSFEDKVEDADADAANEIQTLTRSGNTISLSKSGGSFTDAVNDADADATNEIQTLSIAGNVVSLTQGGSVTLNSNDADANPTNELQTLSLTGNKLSLSSGGGEVTLTDQVNDADANASNELITAVTYDASAQQVTVSEGANSKSVSLTNLASKSYVNAQVQAAVAANSGGLKFVAFGELDGESCNVTVNTGSYMSSYYCQCSGGASRVRFGVSTYACVIP